MRDDEREVQLFFAESGHETIGIPTDFRHGYQKTLLVLLWFWAWALCWPSRSSVFGPLSFRLLCTGLTCSWDKIKVL